MGNRNDKPLLVFYEWKHPQEKQVTDLVIHNSTKNAEIK